MSSNTVNKRNVFANEQSLLAQTESQYQSASVSKSQIGKPKMHKHSIKPYECQVDPCNKSFIKPLKLKDHKRHYHPQYGGRMSSPNVNSLLQVITHQPDTPSPNQTHQNQSLTQMNHIHNNMTEAVQGVSTYEHLKFKLGTFQSLFKAQKFGECALRLNVSSTITISQLDGSEPMYIVWALPYDDKIIQNFHLQQRKNYMCNQQLQANPQPTETEQQQPKQYSVSALDLVNYSLPDNKFEEAAQKVFYEFILKRDFTSFRDSGYTLDSLLDIILCHLNEEHATGLCLRYKVRLVLLLLFPRVEAFITLYKEYSTDKILIEYIRVIEDDVEPGESTAPYKCFPSNPEAFHLIKRIVQ